MYLVYTYYETINEMFPAASKHAYDKLFPNNKKK